VRICARPRVRAALPSHGDGSVDIHDGISAIDIQLSSQAGTDADAAAAIRTSHRVGDHPCGCVHGHVRECCWQLKRIVAAVDGSGSIHGCCVGPVCATTAERIQHECEQDVYVRAEETSAHDTAKGGDGYPAATFVEAV